MEKRIPRAELKRIHGQFMKEVVGTYDSRNTGNYFVYDSEANYKQGITPKRLGRKLGEKAGKLVYDAFALSLPILLDLQEKVGVAQRGDTTFESSLREIGNKIYWTTNRIKSAEDSKLMNAYDSKEAFIALSGLSLPGTYDYDLGEMVFHQVRIHPSTGLGGLSSDWTCRTLDKILDELHCMFLEERKPEFGEALARELLSREADFNYACDKLPAQEVLNAIDRYRVTNENLIRAAEQALVIDAQSYADLTSIKRQEEAKKESYKEQIAKVLVNVGIKDLHE